MEQHPVPQNVTTFQFHLVGDMTLKQFGYLAGGVILAYISTKLPLPFFFTWPMTFFFALGGFGLAFVPVEERPMDIWIASFLRNTYSPTQYVWHKTAKEQPPKSQSWAMTVPQAVVAPQKPLASDLFSRLYGDKQNPIRATSPPAAPTLTVSGQHPFNLFGPLQKFFKKTSNVSSPHVSFPALFDSLSLPPIVRKITPSLSPPAQKNAPQPEKPVAPPTVSPAQRVANAALDQQKLADQMAQIKTETRPIHLQRAPTAAAQPTVRAIGIDAAVAAGFPKLTTFPSVVTGIVKDDRGNLLPGALVTVRDANDTPLRALKTNKLGQFAASTPLPNGTYLVEVEDPQSRYTFDRAQITVNGAMLSALEIIAKSQKKIEREKLEKAIFGNTT